MKKLLLEGGILGALIGAILVSCGAPVHTAFAVRETDMGFEVGTTRSNNPEYASEITTTNFMSQESSTVHSGFWALQTNITVADGNAACQAYHADQSVNFARVYVYVITRPSANAPILALDDTAQAVGGLMMNTSGTVSAWAWNGAVTKFGAESAVIATGTWTELEVEVTSTVSLSIGVTGRVNGTQFVSASNATTNSGTAWTGQVCVGNAEGANSATSNIIFDDVAVNDNTGSNNNSWPGVGSEILYTASAAGDGNSWLDNSGNAGTTNNYTLSNTVPPNSAKFIQASSTSANDFYVMSPVSSTLPANSTINAVLVGGVWEGATTTAGNQSQFKLQIEQASAGTVASSAAQTPNFTSFRYNGGTSGTGVQGSKLVQVNDPTGAAWTNTTIGTMQIGAVLTTSHAAAVKIDQLNAYVDYIPGTPSVGATNAISQTMASVIGILQVSNSTLKVAGATFQVQ